MLVKLINMQLDMFHIVVDDFSFFFQKIVFIIGQLQTLYNRGYSKYYTAWVH